MNQSPKLPKIPWSPARTCIIILATLIGLATIPLLTPTIFNHRWMLEVLIYSYLISGFTVAMLWMQMEKFTQQPTRLTLDFARSLGFWLLASGVILVGSFSKFQYPLVGELMERTGLALGTTGLVCNLALAVAMISRIKRSLREAIREAIIHNQQENPTHAD